MGVERARRRERRGGRGDDGKDTRDAGGGGGVNGRGDRLRSANANKCQQMCARCVLVRADMRTCVRVGGRTLAHAVAVAAQEGPPIPPVKAGPSHGLSRAVRSRAHALSGRLLHPVGTVDGNRVACARARAREPPNARSNASSSREDHGDMRRMLGRARIEAGGHLDHLQASRRWTKTPAGKAAAESI